ncbi:MAG: YchJ family protein [Thalassotalea sp.]
MTCYCGSTQHYQQCCQPFIEGNLTPSTPEQLMRSRYSAYATKNCQYIFNTYAQAVQKENSLNDIAQWAEQTQWLALIVKQACSSTLTSFDPNNPPTVSFDAFYQQDKQFYKMSECSRFIVENNQWRYLNGDVEDHLLITSPKRNDSCFCGSGKKFKKCCG